MFQALDVTSIVKVKVLVTQSCPALCDPMDCSPSGFSVPGIYCSGLTFPPPRDFRDPWIEPRSPALQADCFLSEPPGRPITSINICLKKKKGFYLIAFSHLLICSRVYIVPLSLSLWHSISCFIDLLALMKQDVVLERPIWQRTKNSLQVIAEE